jgi:hypothetical protein
MKPLGVPVIIAHQSPGNVGDNPLRKNNKMLPASMESDQEITNKLEHVRALQVSAVEELNCT